MEQLLVLSILLNVILVLSLRIAIEAIKRRAAPELDSFVASYKLPLVTLRTELSPYREPAPVSTPPEPVVALCICDACLGIVRPRYCLKTALLPRKVIVGSWTGEE